MSAVNYREIWNFEAEGLNVVIVHSLQKSWVHALGERGEQGPVRMLHNLVFRGNDLARQFKRDGNHCHGPVQCARRIVGICRGDWIRRAL